MNLGINEIIIKWDFLKFLKVHKFCFDEEEDLFFV